MEFDNHFEVSVSPERVWDHLLDVEAVVPCMPGAELTETVGDDTWKGKVTVKLGAASLSFKGTVSMTERDAESRRVVLDAKGMEARGKGQATAVVTSTMSPTDDGGTRVDIHTELTLTGQAAQMGRGMIGDVSRRLTGEFADCVAEQLRQGSAEPAPDGVEPFGPAAATDPQPAATGPKPAATNPQPARPTASAAPVSGLRLGAWAVWQALKRGVRRLFGSRGAQR